MYIFKLTGKKRLLGILIVIDIVIQQVIAQVLSGIYNNKFSDKIFSFRLNYFCEVAIIKASEYINEKF